MPQTMIIVSDENGECRIQLEKGARNGTRQDQKIATQLVDLAVKMMNPKTMGQIKKMQSNPQIGNLMKMFGL